MVCIRPAEHLKRGEPYVVTQAHPDHDLWADVLAVEDWIADGCPPVEGFPATSEDERALLLARPLTVRQAARREAVSERTIYRWLTSGELAAHRAGRGWRIAPDALDRRRIEAARPKPKPAQKRRPRKHVAKTGGASWLS